MGAEVSGGWHMDDRPLPTAQTYGSGRRGWCSYKRRLARTFTVYQPHRRAAVD
ncbi:hypothetical protein [Kribbella jejuensis]|uniref:hypothetical protein n=1 Tax=Kribbella jejuensis TaxID=236068 RepID=UPI00163A6113|nr:hypothetical protein [Kribbella jejuensis]